MIILIMGVCGSGKSTIGERLAALAHLPYYDADDFHPRANVAKMSAGIPLSEEDRIPWLDAIAARIPDWEKEGGAILGCSALRESYRQRLRAAARDLRVVYLRGSKEVIRARMADRSGHFMPPDLIESQFGALEEPEDALTLDIEAPPGALARTIIERLGLK